MVPVVLTHETQFVFLFDLLFLPVPLWRKLGSFVFPDVFMPVYDVNELGGVLQDPSLMSFFV